MPTICPKCNYVRRDADTCPDWQCPACQVAYIKARDTRYVADVGESFREEVENSAGWWKWILVLVVVVAFAWQSKYLWKTQASQSNRIGSEQAVQSLGQPNIIFYSATWCGYCDATREFFKSNGIRYTEYDIENSAEGVEGYRRLGGGGIPLILVGDEKIRGFSESGLRRMLAPWIRGS